MASRVQVEDAETQRFKAAAARLMGDINDAGDAPFRGEVQLDSKVCLSASPPS